MSLATVDSSRQAQPREREANDWYVEPEWAVRGLLDVQRFSGSVWDPACGKGTIPRTLSACGVRSAFGTDLMDRGYGSQVDFLTVPTDDPSNQVANIASNPPFNLAKPFLRHALKLARHKVAFLLRLSWLEGQSRRWIFDETPLAAIHPFAARVSMPPGNSTVKPKGGAVAFAWYVWDWSHPIGAPPILRRIERKPS